MKEEMKKLNNLPRITDRISFLYVEYARIETEEYTIVILQGSNKIVIPIATVLCLILGTGISITHNVIKILCENQCNCMFVGSECNYFYASGNSSDRNAQNIIQQAECYYDKDKHLQIVKHMYKKRYPNINITTTNLATLRGYRR